MSVGSFTFRCGECNRLLGVSRSRVGQTIVCPKCGTEQPVPDPDILGDSGTPSGSIVTPPAAPASAVVPPLLAATPPGGTPPVPPILATPAPVPVAEPAFAGLQLDPEPLSIRPTEGSRVRPPRRAAEAPAPVGEAPSAARPAAAAADDVVLPRAAVRFWTLASLVGSVTAFLAGLLAGHFLWRG
jgi:hypothetical protein